MLNNTIYKDELNKWLYNIILDYVNFNRLITDDILKYMSENIVFITFNFSREKLAQRIQTNEHIVPFGDIEFKQFGHFYNIVCREILGRDFLKLPSHEKPLAIACLDAEGSRYWSAMRDIRNAHIHSIWVMKPGMKETVLALRNRALSMDIFDFNQIDVQPFRSSIDDSLPTLISYLLKFDVFNQPNAEVADALRFYPLAKDGPRYDNASW